jgi:hypothetical protein
MAITDEWYENLARLAGKLGIDRSFSPRPAASFRPDSVDEGFFHLDPALPRVSVRPRCGPLRPAKSPFRQQSRKSLKRMKPSESNPHSFGLSIKLSNKHQGVAKRNE